METLIADYLSKLEFGELQSFQNMGVIPLLTSINGSPKYLTLKEALEKKLLKVKEVDEGGSVPDDLPPLIVPFVKLESTE